MKTQNIKNFGKVICYFTDVNSVNLEGIVYTFENFPFRTILHRVLDSVGGLLETPNLCILYFYK